MKSQTSATNQLTTPTTGRATTNSVQSKDGTTIGYLKLGRGPGVVLFHGGMESIQSHIQLAEELADSFTVYLPDRRGRGISGPHGKDYSAQKEVEDLDALLTKTGAHNVFGLSSSAIVLLHAALSLPAIHKAVIFEPPLLVSLDYLPRFTKEIDQGNVAAALTTAMLATQMGPSILNVFPRWLLERLTNMMLASEDKNAKSDDVTLRTLAPTHYYEAQLVAESKGRMESFGAIQSEVLLLGGSKSPTYLKQGLDALEKVLPHARRVELPGVGHGATGNTNRGGKPELVAQELRRFFA